MEKQHIFLLIIFSLFLLTLIVDAKDNCSPVSCGPNQPEIRFPFHIFGRQSEMCGFPGFGISCDEQNQTTIQFPLSSVSYIVKLISYLDQVISIDPEFCRPNRIVSVNTTNTPFESLFGTWDYTFVNCSTLHNPSWMYVESPFPCLSNINFSVVALQIVPAEIHSDCKVMETIMVPKGLKNDFKDKVELMWYSPYCGSCEREGKSCRLTSDNGDTVCVSPSHGISQGVEYALIAIGVPALICIIGVARYAFSRVQGHNDSNNQGIDLSSLEIIRQPASRMGLDGPTIESYPKTVVGDSCSLPKDERICAICLSDYKPKDMLRMIPECNHCFHVECIDAWLKLNITCPVCRKTPEGLTLVTPCSNT